MNRMTTLVLGLACLGIGFDATAGERNLIEQIAEEAGVSTRKVRMVLGSRSAFAEYRYTYDRIAPRVHAAAERLAAKGGPDAAELVAIAERAAEGSKDRPAR